MRGGLTRMAVIGAMAAPLSGCLSDAGGAPFVAMMATGDATATPKLSHSEKVNTESTVIQGLVARRSLLPSGSSYGDVADAVLAANARTAEAELRAARLRSEAASKNWLPRIGPNISITSMSGLIANLVVDQVLFDHGRLKGEGEFAVADVEVAAVGLAEDTNDRVSTALGLYVDAVEAREKAALADVSLRDMGQFEYIMNERVKGGVSDRSDLNVLRQKLAEIRADRAAQGERAATALAELNAMSARNLSDLRGAPPLSVRSGAAVPLAVVKAEAEKTRAIAAAKVERANQLPGLSANASVGEGGGVGVQTDNGLLGFGTGARLKAIEAAREAAERQVAQTEEDTNRALLKLEGQIAAKRRHSAEAVRLTIQAKETLDLFQAQYDAGQRQVIDVVSVYETFTRQQHEEVTLKFETVQLQIELARILGVLADGGEI